MPAQHLSHTSAGLDGAILPSTIVGYGRLWCTRRAAEHLRRSTLRIGARIRPSTSARMKTDRRLVITGDDLALSLSF